MNELNTGIFLICKLIKYVFGVLRVLCGDFFVSYKTVMRFFELMLLLVGFVRILQGIWTPKIPLGMCRSNKSP